MWQDWAVVVVLVAVAGLAGRYIYKVLTNKDEACKGCPLAENCTKKKGCKNCGTEYHNC
jgi:hypothetical protein